MAVSLRIHEMVQELDPAEAEAIKQQSRIEEAQTLRRAREVQDRERQAQQHRVVMEGRSRAKG